MRYFLLFFPLVLASCSEKEKEVDIYVTCTSCDVRCSVDGGDLIWDKEVKERNGFHASLVAKKDDGVTVTACEESESGITQIRVVADGESIKEEFYTGNSCFIFHAFIP